jgi:diadenosine tetraphosphatase ApaH/serine/threonine PP2A family protein phosphatase
VPYTPDKPANAESSDELRARIPGWGVDLDPADRPSVPMLKFQPDLTGAHWEFPERQPEKWPRERSIEHKFLTPVFGTSCPPHGLSGAIRRYAYRYSEGRAAHWLVLLAGDRVDSVGSSFRSFLTLHPDNPITETGVLAEVKHHGLTARTKSRRTDVTHQLLDPLVIGVPWVLRYAVVYGVGHTLVRVGRRAGMGRLAGKAGHAVLRR